MFGHIYWNLKLILNESLKFFWVAGMGSNESQERSHIHVLNASNKIFSEHVSSVFTGQKQSSSTLYFIIKYSIEIETKIVRIS